MLPAQRGLIAAATTVALVGIGLSAAPAFAAGQVLTFSPASVASGAPVTIGGSGWQALDSVTVSLSGPASANICTVRADSTGTIANQACAVPTFIPFGSYTVTGTSSSGATKNATGKLALTPTTTVTNPNGSVVTTAVAGTGLGASGNGFAASSAVKVRVDGVNVATTPATPVTNSGGSISGITYTLPAATTAGTHTVSLRDGQNHSSDFVISVFRPTLSIGAAAVTAGQPVTVSGAKWPPGDTINLFLVKTSPAFNAFLCSVRTDGAGTITPGQACNVTTSLPAGTYQLVGADASRYATLTGANVNLGPSASVLTPGFSTTVTAAAGTLVQLSGAGFGTNQRITATVNGVDAPTTPTVARASVSGTLSGTSIIIPAATAAGSRDVVLTDVAGRTATATITVFRPTITVSPANAAAGTPVVVSGAGWPAGDLISVQLSGNATAATICNVPVDSTGTLKSPPQQCFVPGNLPFGNYGVTGSDFQRYVTKTGANFSLSPSIALSNSGGTPIASGAPGDTVFFSGSGFAAGSSVTVKFNGVSRPTTPSPATTASNGAVSGVSFTVPTIADGTYTVAIKDTAGHTATASFKVT